jgi:hypothetical protein
MSILAEPGKTTVPAVKPVLVNFHILTKELET